MILFTLLACAKQPNIESPVTTQAHPMAEFKPGGSPCLDVTLAYFLYDQCANVIQYGDAVDTTGVFMSCEGARAPEQYGQGTYYIASHDIDAAAALPASPEGEPPYFAFFCADPVFQVWHSSIKMIVEE